MIILKKILHTREKKYKGKTCSEPSVLLIALKCHYHLLLTASYHRSGFRIGRGKMPSVLCLEVCIF